jgi:hypothetical protein
MNKGLAVIEVNDTETKGFYIDQDALEFARLNAKIKKRVDAAEEDMKNASRNHTKTEKETARHTAYTLKTVGRILLNCAICGGVVGAGFAGLVAPIVYVPVSLFCLCAACLRLGAWFGRSK